MRELYSIVELIVFIVLLFVIVPILGTYMARVFQGNQPISILTRCETSLYRLCNIDSSQEMSWKEYLRDLIVLNVIGFFFLFLLQVFQKWLPLNPQEFSSVEPCLAFNTAMSFVTNTNWQAYAGENTMSYGTSVLGLTVQNFLSAATGNAVLLALIRGISGRSLQTIGNFWVDLTRTVIHVLLPFSIIFSIVLVSQGVIQNFTEYQEITTLAHETQVIPMGPVASQVAIKQLGTNGGGFFAANSAHPFENPTPFSNFLETFALVCIPAASTYMYGLLIGDRRQGILLFFVMVILWIGSVAAASFVESSSNPSFEGKEVRFGSENSVVWAVSTTATSNGSVNCMHSSLKPLTGGILLWNMMIGEVIFGGVGVGMCGMLCFVLLTVFIAGLMIGRTPEYLGKRIEKVEMQWVMLALLTPCLVVLLGSALGCVVESFGNKGPHGFSEILYTFSSTANNNGSAFNGFNANTFFYNTVLGIVMLIGRISIIVPTLALAGSLVKKPTMATSLGTLKTDTPVFAVLLMGTILIVAALTFFPALSLGPIVEQILMLQGRTF